MGHVLENLTQFARLLRLAGLPVPAGATIAAARALEHVDIGRRQDFRLALRAALVSRAEELPVFDHAFRVFWSSPSGAGTKLDLRPLGSERRFGDPVVEMESLSGTAGSDSHAGEAAFERVQISTYSDREVCRQ